MDFSVINEKELGAAIAAGLAPKFDQLSKNGGQILADAVIALLRDRQLHADVTVGGVVVEVDIRLEPGVTVPSISTFST